MIALTLPDNTRFPLAKSHFYTSWRSLLILGRNVARRDYRRFQTRRTTPQPDTKITRMDSLGDRIFPQTRWTRLQAATSSDAAVSSAALEELCTNYWQPLFRYVRSKHRLTWQETEDLVQGFFEFVVRSDYFAKADQERGRLRAFLKVSIDRYCRNQWRAGQAEKRGKDLVQSLGDGLDDLAEHTEDWESQLFDREWARTLFDQSMAQLEREYVAKMGESQFQSLRKFLLHQPNKASYDEVAEAHGWSNNFVRVTIHRMRKRLGTIMRTEVASSIGSKVDLDDELAYLREILANASV